MKLNLWNSHITVEAETHQDVAWLNAFIEQFEDITILDTFISVTSGEIDSDGTITEDNDYEAGLSKAKRDSDDRITDVIKIEITPYGTLIPEAEMKLLENDYQKMKKGYEEWKAMLKKDLPDRYKEVIDYEDTNVTKESKV